VSDYFTGKNYISVRKNYIMENILREFQTGSFISAVYSMKKHNLSIVDFIKIIRKNLVNKANLSLAFMYA